MAPNPTLDSTQNQTSRSARNQARISTRNAKPKLVGLAGGLLACLTLAAGIAGCRVQVDKGANGEQKKVQVDTPFGGIHVNTDQTSAADLGLPTYPGANIVNDKDNEKSADIHMGFGEWELRVKIVNFSTPDSQDKVLAFYKNALTRYGDVITCKGTTPVGTPTVTSEGLTCEDDKNNTSTVQIDRDDYGSGESSLELKAGSKRHQHIVAFQSSAHGETRFALVALDLPAVAVNGSGKSD
jgi:hypothetical protein